MMSHTFELQANTFAMKHAVHPATCLDQRASGNPEICIHANKQILGESSST
jgi:hypothetical protein